MATQPTSKVDLLIAHIGDTHLRDSQYAASRRGDDFFAGFMNAVKAACSVADVLVITGDIFDQPRPSPKVIGQLMSIDHYLRWAGKVAFTITGNHDWSSPTWLSTLFPGRVLGSEDDGVETLKWDENGIVPLDNANVIFRGHRFVGLTPHTATSFRSNLADVTVRARNADVVLFHGLIAGVVDFPIHSPDPLRVDELPISQHNKAWLLGDIHLQGFVERARPGGGTCLVGYPGSTEMCSASEPTEKSVPIIRLTADSAALEKVVTFKVRPNISAVVETDADLDNLMRRIAPVADQHPVVTVQFNRQLTQTINRLHSSLDAQRAVIRCYPLPEQKNAATREKQSTDSDDRNMEYFLTKRFEKREDLQKIALDLLYRGETDASNIISAMIEARLATTGVREAD